MEGGNQRSVGDIGLPANCLQGINHNRTLQTHFGNLSSEIAQGPNGSTNTTETNDDQEIVSNGRPVSSVFGYTHGGEFADRYGPILIVSSFLAIVPFGFWGCEMAHRRANWWAGLWWGMALLCGLLGTGSGSIGCLPWDWHRCLCDGQNHSENYPQRVHEDTLQHYPPGSFGIKVSGAPVFPNPSTVIRLLGFHKELFPFSERPEGWSI